MPLGPEDEARHNIDDVLAAAGWAVQDADEYDPGVAERGIAVREYPFESRPADYLLVVDREAVGIVEAKSEGTTLGGIAEQSQKYATSDPKHIPPAQHPLPFVYESTGVETNFRDLRDPAPAKSSTFTNQPRCPSGSASRTLCEPACGGCHRSNGARSATVHYFGGAPSRSRWICSPPARTPFIRLVP